VQQEYPGFYQEFLAKTSDFRYPPDGESGDDVRKRVEKFLKELYAGPMRHIGIITHGGVIRSIVSFYLGMPQHKRFLFTPYNCGISRVKYNLASQQTDVITVNEIGHLQGIETF
jgi:probable phosphoglycerate mutase